MVDAENLTTQNWKVRKGATRRKKERADRWKEDVETWLTYKATCLGLYALAINIVNL